MRGLGSVAAARLEGTRPGQGRISCARAVLPPGFTPPLLARCLECQFAGDNARGKIEAKLWAILKCRDHVPSDRALRALLSRAASGVDDERETANASFHVY